MLETAAAAAVVAPDSVGDVVDVVVVHSSIAVCWSFQIVIVAVLARTLYAYNSTPWGHSHGFVAENADCIGYPCLAAADPYSWQLEDSLRCSCHTRMVAEIAVVNFVVVVVD